MAARRAKSDTTLSIVPKTAKSESAAPKVPSTLVEAIGMGERDVLVMTRRTLAATIDAGPAAHALASLARHLLEVDQKIRAIDLRAKEDGDGGAPVEDGTFDASAV